MSTGDSVPFTLKAFFDRALVSRLGDALASAGPFDGKTFVREATRGLEDLELIDRGRHIAAAMARALPRDFDRAADQILASLGARDAATEGKGMAPFFYLPHTIFVTERGLDHFETSMKLQHALTQRFSAEFSIRPFLDRHRAATLARLARFAEDESEHVRRLVSEGTRPRLPWAPRLRTPLSPSDVLPLLERLKDDPSLYVRRSVANHLNDIGKDHPALLLEVAARWMQGASPERAYVVRHGLRSLVKKGDPQALGILGFRGAKGIVVSGGATRPRVKIGEAVQVELEVRNDARARADAVVDLAVHFVKASGATSAKVFKLREVSLAPNESLVLRKSISFRVHTTRKPYAGHHRIEALINGRAVPLRGVEVRAR